MSEQFDICDLHDTPHREALLYLNNASARETSLLTQERFDRLIRSAHVALFVPPAVALLLAFEDTDDYDRDHFLWFRRRPCRFLYVDRIVISRNGGGADWPECSTKTCSSARVSSVIPELSAK